MEFRLQPAVCNVAFRPFEQGNEAFPCFAQPDFVDSEGFAYGVYFVMLVQQSAQRCHFDAAHFNVVINTFDSARKIAHLSADEQGSPTGVSNCLAQLNHGYGNHRSLEFRPVKIRSELVSTHFELTSAVPNKQSKFQK
ncbi:MAG: hypothetical protein ABIP14_04320 [Blastocatellia bacterium]